jgi:hypothetical protein
MSVKIMGMVWDLDVEPNKKLILLAYADHADHEGRSIYPAVATIAKKTGYSERSVQQISRQLEELKVLLPDGQGPHGTNKWRIPVKGGAIFAPAIFAPVQDATGGGAEIAPLGVQPTAPEPSFNHPLTDEEEKEKTKLLKDLQGAALSVFGSDFMGCRKLFTELEAPGVKIHRLDDQLSISGVGIQAAVFQDRYAKSFSRALEGIYNASTEVIFDE